jgi:type VI secretion system protein ImpH
MDPEQDRTPTEGPFDDPTLTEELYAEPYRFEFFAALRVLARLSEDEPAAADSSLATQTALRFRAHQSLSFPASEVVNLEPSKSDPRIQELTVAFFGLTGPMGALPRPYSELVMQRVRKSDFALRDFLDLFNHRLIQIFAAAGEKYRFYLTHEVADARERLRRRQGAQKLRGFLLDERPRIDLFSQVLLDLAGLGTPLLRYKDSIRDRPAPRTALADATLRYFSGHLSQTHRSATALGQIVSEYFALPCKIISFVGQWIQLPLEHQTCMRRRDLALLGGQSAGRGTCAEPRLGRNTVVGSRIWEVQGRFRIRLGPLTFEQFQTFLPVGKNYRTLAHLARLFAGPTFDFDIQPVLEGADVPWCQLGAKGAAAPRLGWTTWLRNRPFQAPVDDAIFAVPDQVSMAE